MADGGDRSGAVTRRRGMRLLAPLLLTAACLAGCSAVYPRLETPKLSLVGVEVVEATLFEQRLQVRLRVQNPNDVVLPVRGLAVQFELAGQEFAEGVSARAFEVPAFGEAEFDVLVTANAATTLLKLLAEGRGRRAELDYRIRGKLSTSLGLLRTVPFEESGRIPLKSAKRSADDAG